MERWLTLSADDVDAVVELAGRADRTTPSANAIESLLAALSRLIPCDDVLWTRFDLAASRTIAQVGFPRLPRADGSPGRHAVSRDEPEMTLGLSHLRGERQDLVFSRRAGPDFDDRERLILKLLAPHLDAALGRLTLPAVRLTPREAEVLRCVRDGMPTRLIARELGVAECTVVKHLEHVYARIGAHNRAQALQLCSTALS
jgi:DNA-binding CsgD family transcriptional regulator